MVDYTSIIKSLELELESEKKLIMNLKKKCNNNIFCPNAQHIIKIINKISDLNKKIEAIKLINSN